MNGFKKKALPAAITLALGGGMLAAGSANAGNFYLGAGLGSSLFDISERGLGRLAQDGLENTIDPFDNPRTFANGGSGATGSLDGSSHTAWNVYGGYRFTDNFALEAGYIRAGSVKANVSGTVDGPEGFSGSGRVKVSGIGFWGVGILPLSDTFSVFGKLGAVRWHEQFHGMVDMDFSSPPPVEISINHYGTDFAYGAGANLMVWKNVGVRVEWQRMNFKDGNADIISGGLNWQFK
jgi:OOP family OmpA-OmpF porin